MSWRWTHFPHILFDLGCLNKISWSRCFNKQTFIFSNFWKLRSPRSWHQMIHSLGRTATFSLCAHVGKKKRGGERQTDRMRMEQRETEERETQSIILCLFVQSKISININLSHLYCNISLHNILIIRYLCKWRSSIYYTLLLQMCIFKPLN
jgi:hypothetical protein